MMADELAIHAGALPVAALVPPCHRSWGGVCSFTGVVRDHHHGRLVRGLHYQVYRPMAVAVLVRLADEARAAAGGAALIRVMHAAGDLVPGDAAVAIHVATAHRDAAFAGCRLLIERLKADLPVWKRETYDDGAVVWLRGS
jgi:molybdopterin synthase catalytic subunit